MEDGQMTEVAVKEEAFGGYNSAREWFDAVREDETEETDEARQALIDEEEERIWEYHEDGYSEEFQACSLKEAMEWAENRAKEGDYDLSDGPVFVTFYVECEETRESDSGTVIPKQEEPDCKKGHTHEWVSPHWLVGGCESNPGVWGNGGGVIIKQACLICGKGRVTDTWGQNPEDGTQGHTIVTYTDEFEYDITEWKLNKRAEEAQIALDEDVELPLEFKAVEGKKGIWRAKCPFEDTSEDYRDLCNQIEENLPEGLELWSGLSKGYLTVGLTDDD